MKGTDHQTKSIQPGQHPGNSVESEAGETLQDRPLVTYIVDAPSVAEVFVKAHSAQVENNILYFYRDGATHAIFKDWASVVVEDEDPQ